MSTQEVDSNAAPKPEETAPVVEEIVVKRRGFNLDSFKRESLESKVKFTPLPKDDFLPEVLQRLNGSQEDLYTLLNAGLRRKLSLDSRKDLTPAEGQNWIPSAKIVLDFVNNFRGVAPYSKEKDRAKQTTMIMAFIKSTPALVESLKVLATAAEGAGDDEETEDNASDTE